MKLEQLLSKEKEVFLQTYNRIPINIERGEGVYLFDNKNIRYLDFMSGLGVSALGHSNPKIISAITNQINKYSHLSNYFVSEIQVTFTEKLLKFSDMDKALHTNSGTEAVECAIKLIRMKFGPEKIIFSLTNSFHGRTYGALSLTAREKHRIGFEPLLKNIDNIEFNNIKDLLSKINGNTAAVFLEFIQGEGGINTVTNEFVNNLSDLRDKYKFLIVADEIQSGIGRTGKNFAFQYYNFKPDIIVTAKAIGGGLPLGALLVNDSLKNVFEYGKHGTTFGGNSVSCASGMAVIDFLNDSNLVNKVNELSLYIFNKLNELKTKYPTLIESIRGKGFMIGIVMKEHASSIVEQLRGRYILTNLTAGNVIRLLPPLITEQDHLDIFLEQFSEILTEFV